VANTTGQSHCRLAFTTTSTLASGAIIPISIDLPGNVPTAIANGTTAGSANLGWHDSRTLTATSVTFDLTTLAAASTNTGAAAFSTITHYRITNDAAIDSSNPLTIGNASATQFLFNGVGSTTTFILPAGGTLQLSLPNTAGIVCSTNKNLKLDAGAGTVPFSITLIGRV
jgi:hypothetical protein